MSNKAIVLDANILIRAVLGRRVRELIIENASTVKFFSPDVAYADARKYLPALLEKRGVMGDAAMMVLDGLEGVVQAIEFELYAGMQAQALQRIAQGVYQETRMIPSENELIKDFGVTRLTLRSALRMLQSDGLIITQKGKGSFLRPPKVEQSLFRFYSFGRDFNGDEYNPDTELISAETVPVNEIARQKLNLPEGDLIFRIIRLRKMHGLPVILEISHVPCRMAEDLTLRDLGKASIYDLLEKEYAHPILKAREYLECVNCNEYFAKFLDIETGKAVFVADRVTVTTGEVPMEYRISYIRGDAFRFTSEF